MLLFYGAGLYYLAVGVPGLGYSRHTELVPVGWRDFGRQIGGIADALRAQVGDDLLVVGMDRYAIASELAFYSNDQARSVASTTSAHLFDGVGSCMNVGSRPGGNPDARCCWSPGIPPIWRSRT